MKTKIITLIFISLLFFSTFSSVFATASITPSPTSGNVGTTVSVSGSGYGQNSAKNSLTQNANPNIRALGGNIINSIYLLPFVIPSGSLVTNFELDIADNGTKPTTASASCDTARNFGSGTLWLTQFSIPRNSIINTVTLDIQGNAGNHNYNVKVYDVNGLTWTEDGEVGATFNGATGQTNFTLNIKTGSDTIAIGTEMGDANAALGSKTSCLGGGTYDIAHSFGSGPSTITNPASASGFSNKVNVYYTPALPAENIKVYNSDGPSGAPLTLLKEVDNQTVTVSANTNYTLNVGVPSTGKIYIGFEINNTQTNIGSLSGATTSGYQETHSFGSGPSSFSGTVNPQTYFMKAFYTTTPVTSTFKLDGNLISTNPSTVYTDTNGAFSGVTFTVPPSTTTNPHVINVTDNSGNKATANFNIPVIDPVFSEWLHDLSAQIISGFVQQTWSGGKSTIPLNGTGYASFTANAGQNYNYTFWDNSNEFIVYKLINNSTTTGFTDKQPVWEWPFNCVSPYTGFQSDFIFQQNDTDGHHITSMTQPVCTNQDEVKYNVTYTANGTSNTSYNGLTRIVEGGALFQPNPTSFNVNGTSVGTISTTGVDILSNAYSIGSGLKTILNEFDIIFQRTSSGTVGGGGSTTNFSTNATCFAGVYNTQTNQCQFGLVGFNVTAPIITINPTNTSSTTINLQCSGVPYLTINNVNLGSNPLGLQIYGLPTTINCGTQPSSCPSGTTLQNGQCVGNPVCPISSQLSNGVCVGTMSCPAGTTMQNGQCLAPAVCSNGAMPVNGQCPNSGNVTLIAPPNPNGTNNCSINNISACVTNNNNTCSITNPLACFTGTTQTEPATITGTTSNGQIVSAKTIITALQSPELNIVSLIFILLILAAIVGGVIYRHYKGKEKKKKHRSNGKDNSIRKFNENLRKK